MPMQPKGPGSSIIGALNPTRAKARKSPPSVITTESLPMACWSAESTLFGCNLPSEPLGAFAMLCCSFFARSSCPPRSFAAHCRSTLDSRFPAYSTIARWVSAGERESHFARPFTCNVGPRLALRQCPGVERPGSQNHLRNCVQAGAPEHAGRNSQIDRNRYRVQNFR